VLPGSDVAARACRGSTVRGADAEHVLDVVLDLVRRLGVVCRAERVLHAAEVLRDGGAGVAAGVVVKDGDLDGDLLAVGQLVDAEVVFELLGRELDVERVLRRACDVGRDSLEFGDLCREPLGVSLPVTELLEGIIRGRDAVGRRGGTVSL
jgi:hypothetical protein